MSGRQGQYHVGQYFRRDGRIMFSIRAPRGKFGISRSGQGIGDSGAIENGVAIFIIESQE